MGHAIAKIGKDVWHGVKSVGKDVVHVGQEAVHGAEKVGKVAWHGIETGAKDVEHVGEEAVHAVGGALEKAADIATQVVVTVGGVAEHVVSLIPGPLGTTLKNGLAGVVDLAQKGDAGIHHGVEIIEHPLRSIQQAADIVTHPSKLKDALASVTHLISGVSKDVTGVLLAVASLTPEGAEIAPELVALANVGSKVNAAAKAGEDLLSGNVEQALQDGTKFLPKSAQQLAKAVTAATKVHDALQHGNIKEALQAAAPYMPPKAKASIDKLQKLIPKAEAIVHKIAPALSVKMKAEGKLHHFGPMGGINPYCLAFPPGSSVSVLDDYFHSRHPGQRLGYYIFCNGRPLAAFVEK